MGKPNFPNQLCAVASQQRRPDQELFRVLSRTNDSVLSRFEMAFVLQVLAFLKGNTPGHTETGRDSLPLTPADRLRLASFWCGSSEVELSASLAITSLVADQ